MSSKEVKKRSDIDKVYQQIMEHHHHKLASNQTSKKAQNPQSHSKGWKMSNFRHSISRFFRSKSQSSKCLATTRTHNDDELYLPYETGRSIIPSTVYLSPKIKKTTNQIVFSDSYSGDISRKTQHPRHSCSDLICRRSSTFCVHDNCYDQEINKMVVSDSYFDFPKDVISSPKSIKMRNNNATSNNNNNSAFIYYQEHIELPSNDHHHHQQQQQTNKQPGAQSPSFTSQVSHSISVPLQLSQSHQAINNIKSNKQDINTTSQTSGGSKRMSRKKGILNCSLFKKRTKSTEKMTNASSKSVPLNNYSIKTKSLTRYSKSNTNELCDTNNTISNNIDTSPSLVDRCVTLPNLKVPDDAPQASKELFSFDLVKDYLNRSDNTISQPIIQSDSTHQRSFSDLRMYNSNNSAANIRYSNHSSLSVRSNTPLINDMNNATISPAINAHHILNSASTSSSSVACHSQHHSKCSNCALTTNSGTLGSLLNEKPNTHTSHLIRQISAPPPQTPPRLAVHQHHHHRSTPSPPSVTSGPFEFWTKPMQEKLKASRRRLQDNQHGCQEALLRSLSPMSTDDGPPIYQNYHNIGREINYRRIGNNQCHLQVIMEPPTNNNIDTGDVPQIQAVDLTGQLNRSISLYTTNIDNIHHQSPQHSTTSFNNENNNNNKSENQSRSSCQIQSHQVQCNSPQLENRLTKSPMVANKSNESTNNVLTTNYLNNMNKEIQSDLPEQDNLKLFDEISNAVDLESDIKDNELSECTYIKIIQSTNSNLTNRDNKSVKSVNSSTDIVLTRTPTPPQLFGEEFSSISSIPVPTEFNSLDKVAAKLVGNVNLIYKSSDEEDDEEEGLYDYEQVLPQPPQPPPRTDSVIRSYQLNKNDQYQQNLMDLDKSELEYDISSDEALPDIVFKDCGEVGNLESKKCDFIKKYNEWVEKLPYKLKDFPDILQSKKYLLDKESNKMDLEDGSILDAEYLRKLRMVQSGRKLIKSWNDPSIQERQYLTDDETDVEEEDIETEKNRENKKELRDNVPNDPTACQRYQDNFNQLKKSLSYDYTLNNIVVQSDKSSVLTTETMTTTSVEARPTETVWQQPNMNVEMLESTLLKQYSHLYSLKLNLQSPKVSNRNKNMIASSSLESIAQQQQCLRRTDNMRNKRKSVPDSTICMGIEENSMNKNENTNTTDAQLKFYSIM